MLIFLQHQYQELLYLLNGSEVYFITFSMLQPKKFCKSACFLNVIISGRTLKWNLILYVGTLILNPIALDSVSFITDIFYRIENNRKIADHNNSRIRFVLFPYKLSVICHPVKFKNTHPEKVLGRFDKSTHGIVMRSLDLTVPRFSAQLQAQVILRINHPVVAGRSNVKDKPAHIRSLSFSCV